VLDTHTKTNAIIVVVGVNAKQGQVILTKVVAAPFLANSLLRHEMPRASSLYRTIKNAEKEKMPSICLSVNAALPE
jgi:hypothetical protein